MLQKLLSPGLFGALVATAEVMPLLPNEYSLEE
jgi:hypothetical protein